MKNYMTFRRYAEECRRLAKHMKPEHRATLLEIAEAWIRCAEDVERGDAGTDPGDSSEEPISGHGSTRGTRNQAGRPPPRSAAIHWVALGVDGAMPLLQRG